MANRNPLDGLRVAVQGKPIQIGRHEVKILHPEKILFPEDSITKQDLIDYYHRIAPWILPHLRDRPLAMERYPDGIDKPVFFHWSYVSPIGINLGADGILTALEDLSKQEASR
jgi:hypothetical protein